MSYAIALDLSGTLCAVVGAGKVAERKIEGLLNVGAVVRVVGKHATPEIERLGRARHIAFFQRAFDPADLDDCRLVFAATDNSELNDSVGTLARQKSIFFCHCTGGDGDFTVPAILRDGDLMVAVSTGGASPAYAGWLRDYLADHLSKGHAEILSVLKQARMRLREAIPDDSVRRQNIWRSILSQDVIEAVQAGSLDSVKQRISKCLSSSQD
jgi:precorrin-2 dehydrogenase/sirohydrochlorin ferrochelatase